MKKVEIMENQESASKNGSFEERIREISVEGLEEWMMQYRRRRKRMEYVCMVLCVLIMPILTYSFTPMRENGYGVRSTEKIDKKTIYEDAVETYRKAIEQ